MKDTIVIDLDGTLANVGHRRHFVAGKKRDYEAFHALLDKDPVNVWCAEIMRSFADRDPEFRVVLVSARPKHVKEATIAWLTKHHLQYLFHDLFLLRPTGDSTPDQELKRDWLHKYGKDRVLFVVDDRSKVVKMWREEGLVCLQCDDWKETP
jgi:hypothetical protein